MAQERLSATLHSTCGAVLLRKQWCDHSCKKLCIRMCQNCPVRNIQMMRWTILEKGNGGNGQFHVISFLAAVFFSLFIATLWFSQAGTESANTFSLLQALLGLRLHSKASPSARDLWYTQSPNKAGSEQPHILQFHSGKHAPSGFPNSPWQVHWSWLQLCMWSCSSVCSEEAKTQQTWV